MIYHYDVMVLNVCSRIHQMTMLNWWVQIQTLTDTRGSA